MAFKPKTFSPGNPITSTDLNDLQSNIQSIYDDSQKLVNTSKTISGQIQKVATRFSGQTEKITGLTKDKIISKDIQFKGNFTITPVVVASIAEELKDKEAIDLAVYALSPSTCKVSIRTNSATKEVSINIIAISMEPIS
jgi:hypothetical protein